MDDPALFSRPPLVLIVNDEEWTARSLDTLLGPGGYAVVRAFTGRQALDIASSVLPEAIILSVKLPDVDGYDICRRLRANPMIGDITPIIMTTSDAMGRADSLNVYQAGAWDCMRLPLDGDLLLLKLRNYAKARRAADALRQESLLDESTGLYSLRGLARRVQEMAADATRRRAPLACVALSADPDVFDAGASVLDQTAVRVAEHIATVLRRHGRSSDVIGRLSHTEFGLVASATERDGIVRMVERIRDAVETEPALLAGRTQPLRIRVGFSTVTDFAAASIDALGLIMRASAALRHARTIGGEHEMVAYEDVQLGILN